MSVPDHDIATTLAQIDQIINVVPDPIFVKDRQHRWLLLNDAACSLIGHPREALLGKSDHDIFPSAEAEAFWNGDDRIFETGLSDEYEECLTDARGNSHCIVTKKTLYTDAAGNAYIVGVIRDITERQQAAAEIQQLNRRLQTQTDHLASVNRELSDLVYSLSHDLRAPLRGIDGYCRLLQEDYAAQLGEEGQQFLHRIRQAGQQMGQMIQGLLTYSRLERRSLTCTRVAVRALLERLCDEQAPVIAARAIRLHLAVPADFTVRTDPDLFADALRRLLDNAIKFTKPVAAPCIGIGAEHDAHGSTVWVRDNGIGFDPKFHERIFNLFQRLNRAEDYPGTGVGLAIVRKTLERLGGRVWADSAIGQGATFYVSLAADSE